MCLGFPNEKTSRSRVSFSALGIHNLLGYNRGSAETIPFRQG